MKATKILVPILIALVVIAALVYFVFIPQSQAVLLLWAKTRAQDGQITTLETRVARIDELKEEEKKVEKLVDNINQYLPDEEEAGDFLIQIESLANTTNNNLIEITYSKEEDKKQTGTASNAQTAQQGTTAATSILNNLNYEINIEGQYSNLIDYLKRLENIYRFNTIAETEMELETSEAGFSVKMNLTGKIYYKK